MPYGTYNGPNKPDKGKEGGSCNRTSCQCAPADWYNHGSNSWYCAHCRRDIEFDPFNSRDWDRNFKPRLGHPMFETREMMTRRLNGDASDVLNGRDLWEVANQLMGYVGPDTEKQLAEFLMREGQFASDLADEVLRLRTENARLRKQLGDVKSERHSQ